MWAMLATDEKPEIINHLAFSQDAKIISVGHKSGYMFYKTAEILDNMVLNHETKPLTQILPNISDNCLIIERLFSTHLIACVSQKDTRVVYVYTTKHCELLFTHKFKKSVLAVKLNRVRLVVCLEDSILIYSLETQQMIQCISETPINKLGVIDLTTKKGSGLMAFPGSERTGSVHLFDTLNMCQVNTFTAHEGPLACLKFNQDEDMIATASIRGTVIRVYSVPNGHRLFEFRRGVSRCVNIFSLSFSSDSKYLVSSSNTETVHVFSLEKPEMVDSSEGESSVIDRTWYDTFNYVVSAVVPPQVMQVSELINNERSFATARLPEATTHNQVSIVSHKSQQYVMVATSNGFVYAYRLDPLGGELQLIKQHRIGPMCKTPRFSPLADGIDAPPRVHSSG